MVHALSPSSLLPSPPEAISSRTPHLLTLSDVVARHPQRIIVVFAESTTTNGRAILPLSPALGAAPPSTAVFPTSLRYNPADVTTPVPGWRATSRFFWNLCSAPTHTIRVRIAEPLTNPMPSDHGSVKATSVEPNSYATNFFDQFQREGKAMAVEAAAGNGVLKGSQTTRDDNAPLTAYERQMLDRVGEALARLGRVKRVALSVRDKAEFVRVWRRRRRSRA